MQKSIDNQPKIKVLGRLNIKGLDIIKRVYSAEGLAPTLSTMMGGGKDNRKLSSGETMSDMKPRLVGGFGEINFGK